MRTLWFPSKKPSRLPTLSSRATHSGVASASFGRSTCLYPRKVLEKDTPRLHQSLTRETFGLVRLSRVWLILIRTISGHTNGRDNCDIEPEVRFAAKMELE